MYNGSQNVVPTPSQGAYMSDISFDPKTILETYRSAFAPALKVQQEGVKALDRVGRYQYAVAGDCLHWTLAQVKAAVVTQTPAEFLSRQIELATVLSERLRVRAQEFFTLATDAQASFSQVVSEATATVAEVTKKAA